MRKTLALVATLALTVGVPAALLAPGPSPEARGFRIVVSPGAQDFPIALPEPVLEGSASGGELWSVVHRDLDMTGYFDIVDPQAYIDRSGGVAPGTFALDDWRVLDAAVVVKTALREVPGGKVQADLYIYDIASGEKLLGRRFTADASAQRYLGHRISDAVLQALTGKEGLFGSRIAAVGKQTGNKEIYVMDVDGHGVRAVTHNGSINLSPAWSPDGRSLAWTSYKRGNPDLYVKDISRGGTRVLSSREGINSGAAYSPDGTRVALARSHAGDSDIYVIDATTGAEVHRLTRGGGIDVAPDFHPDGTTLAWSSERSGGSQVYVQDTAGGEARRVTFNGDFNTDPVWSPDGTRIAFVGRDPSFDIFVVDANGQNMVRVTQHQGDNEDPSWSPDGRYLVFSSTREGNPQVWMATADGNHQVKVTESGTWTQPTWGP